MIKKGNRALSKDEINLSKKQIEKIGKRQAWLAFQLKYYDLMLSDGLEQNYLKTVREYKEVQKEMKNEFDLNDNIVKELGKQIVEGVEIKKIEPIKSEVEKNVEDFKKRQ